MAGSLWIDVEDMFEYAIQNRRPSGIQRLAFEIYRGLQARDASAGRVHFVRHTASGTSFRVVSWSALEGLFANLTEDSLPVAPAVPPVRPPWPGRQLLRAFIQWLPTTLRTHFIDVLVTSAAAAQAWRRLLTAALLAAPRAAIRRGRAMVRHQPSVSPDTVSNSVPRETINFDERIAPGDIILVLGSPWSYPEYAALIGGLRNKRALKVAILVYDLIPLRRPEWCDSNLVRMFGIWFNAMLPICDQVFAISHATAADLQNYVQQRGITLPEPIIVIPIGTGITALPEYAATGADDRMPATLPCRLLPQPGSYALLVSTIEARKNHLLMFRVWRRLLEDLPISEVPTLVFAGRIGWLVDDLMRQIDNTANLAGKLVVVQSPADAELMTLYNGCLFTVFPSFYEGWGLPVTESLALGKPCVISDRTSLPEAGGALARYFDPDNLHDTYAVIRNAIEDRPGLARWEEKVRREFKPVPWSATIDAILAGLSKEAVPF